MRWKWTTLLVTSTDISYCSGRMKLLRSKMMASFWVIMSLTQLIILSAGESLQED